MGLAIGVFAGVNLLLGGIGFAVWWFLKKRKKSGGDEEEENEDDEDEDAEK